VKFTLDKNKIRIEISQREADDLSNILFCGKILSRGKHVMESDDGQKIEVVIPYPDTEES